MRQFHSEAGSVLVYIFLAIVLFASLSFAVSNIMRSGDPTLISRETAKSYATDILQQANAMRRAVQTMRIEGYDDTSISFENEFVSGYANPNCTEDGCRVFHPDGGGLIYIAPDAGWLVNTHSGQPYYGQWNFSFSNCVEEVGNTACANNDPDITELVAYLPHIRQELCKALNDNLEVSNPGEAPPIAANSHRHDLWDGSIVAATQMVTDGAATDLDGRYSACFRANNGTVFPDADETWIFYQVLIAR